MLKVIRVITRLNIGGPAIHVIGLSGSLNCDGHHKDVLVCGRPSKDEGDMSYLLEGHGVKPLVIPEMGREISFISDLKAFFRLYSIMRREKPDIVHTHTAKAGTLGRIAAIMAGVPVRIHTFHGHVFDGYFSPGKARVFIAIERILAMFTDRVISVSERVRNDVVRNVRVAGARKSIVIPLGLDLDRFLACDSSRGIFRKSISVSADTMLIGIVGRLVPIKNHRMFLDAAKILIQRTGSNNIKFVIIGDGESRSMLERYAGEIGVSGSVLFTGWIEDLASVYSDLDIVAITSLNEGTPVSIIEAMASARPVIATDVGGVADLIRDGVNGILVRSGDAREFAGRILELQQDPARRKRFGVEGREFVKERFSKARLVRDIQELYKECLSASRRHRAVSR